MILIKTKAEIEKIREANRISGLVLKEIAGVIRPNMTTAEVDRISEEIILKAGAKPAFKGYRGYRHATCISVNEQVVHGIPGSRVLKEGDIVTVDVGAIVDGYYGDTARTYAVGKVSDEAQKLMRATREALELGIRQCRGGNHLGDISAAIEQRARQDGFSVVRDMFGHGIGKDLHEDPLIPNFGTVGEGPELRPGMVLAIEPMVNIGGHGILTLKDGWTVVTRDGTLSAHFEHTVLVTEGEAEILSYVK